MIQPQSTSQLQLEKHILYLYKRRTHPLPIQTSNRQLKRMAKAQTFIFVLLVVVIVTMFEAGAICNMSNADMTTCKPAVRKSNPTRPSPACCAALAKADMGCLCSYKGSMMVSYMDIDVDRAMKVPAMCGLRNAPSKC